jgi:hypothetical protein
MPTPGPLNEVVLPQPVVGPLTRAAIFLVARIRPERDNYATLRSFFADLAGLVRAVEFRDVEAGLTCVVGFGRSNARKSSNGTQLEDGRVRLSIRADDHAGILQCLASTTCPQARPATGRMATPL